MEVSDEDFEDLAVLARQHGLDEALRRMARHHPETTRAEWTEKLRAEYLHRAQSAQMGYPPNIIALPHQQPWYSNPLPSDRFWPPLKAALLDSPIPKDQVEKIDAASSKIISYTPNPAQATWTSKGLVVGYVQSGKTTNFTSVIAKAVDVGYNLVVVLSGIHNGLRRQTQERLELQLCELNSGGWITQTTLKSDFRKPPHTFESVLPHGSDRKAVLCVVKKNAFVLKKLKDWLERSRHDGGLRSVKALIIDDEADQASVETPKINPLLRDLIDMLPCCTFIGYTATPFANLLIDPAAGDLYPKDFVLTLPPPEGYFGTEMIFGRDEIPEAGERGLPVDGYNMVRIIGDIEAAALRPHKGTDFEPEITDSLREAVLWFWLATATRRARGDSGHSTMLLHTSMKTAVHQAFRAPLEQLRSAVRQGLSDNDGDLREELTALWERETTAVVAADLESDLGIKLMEVDYNTVRTYLPDVVESTRIVLDNSRSTDRLSYESDSPVTAIAVGGNTLSRGLTLEGLVVSFFIRSAAAYDTLLQMGRWFGFRRGYEDLPRMFMTAELCKWFRHLASVEHEMRLDILRLEEQSLTPEQFGVRLRTHPTLLVTQKLGASVQAFTSYGGRRVQERYFRRTDLGWITARNGAAGALLVAADAHGTRDASAPPGVGLWRDVPVADVQTFIRQFDFHADSPDLNRDLLLAYVEKEVVSGSLDKWSVAVMGAKTEDNGAVDLGGFRFGSIVRARLKSEPEDGTADIKTLMSKEHRVIDLPIDQTAARAINEETLAEMRNSDPERRKQGLLLLYPIQATSAPGKKDSDFREDLDAESDVVAAAFVFPGNAEHSVSNSYISVDLSGVAPAKALEEPEDLDDVILGDTERPED